MLLVWNAGEIECRGRERGNEEKKGADREAECEQKERE